MNEAHKTKKTEKNFWKFSHKNNIFKVNVLNVVVAGIKVGVILYFSFFFVLENPTKRQTLLIKRVLFKGMISRKYFK